MALAILCSIVFEAYCVPWTVCDGCVLILFLSLSLCKYNCGPIKRLHVSVLKETFLVFLGSLS